jgi:hypothetical protein
MVALPITLNCITGGSVLWITRPGFRCNRKDKIMKTFTRMGEALLLAEEGQQQIARALLEALGRGLLALAKSEPR